MLKNTHGGKREGSGRPPHKLGKGVKVSVMIPQRLHDAITNDAELDEVRFSAAVVDRLIRGRKRGRTL